jgi:hypothetical protein
MTVSRLAAETDAVLMDLRAFQWEHQGCVFELRLLVNVGVLDKVVLIVDGSTDLPLLGQILWSAKESLPAASTSWRNDPDRPTICFLARDEQAGINLLLTSLAQIATRDDPGPASGTAVASAGA